MTADSKRNSAYLVFACLSTSCLFFRVAGAVAVQASGEDSSYLAEVTGSAQMMRSEGPHHSKTSPATHDHKSMQTVKAHQSSAVVHADPKVDKKLLHASTVESSPAQTSAAETKNASHAQAIKVELYYESRCPDCIEFVNNTLAPLWRNKELNKHIELTMNPYGNAMTVEMKDISEGYKYWHPERRHGWDYVHICQHGGEECFGNTIHACAISKLPQEKHMELILCMESLPNYGLEKSSFECMEKNSIDKDAIRNCASGAEGNKLLADFGKKTNSVHGRAGTPWLMINGNHLENPSKLLETVCAHVGPGPASCKPFEHKQSTKSHKKEEADEGDEFKVFGKVSNVDRNLVIMPPPKRV